jgi:hypothetical protein
VNRPAYWACPSGHVVAGADACPQCGASWSEGADHTAVAVDRLLASYQAARTRATGQPWRDEVANDICRSAASARDALKAARSPEVAKVESFLDGVAREDFYARAKRAIDQGLGAVNVVGSVVGNSVMKQVNVAALVLFAIAGFVVVLVFVANVAAGLVVAVPIGALVARAPTVIGNTSSWLSEFVRRPNPARQVVDELIAPAEAQFFAIVTGRPPVLRTATVSAAVDSAIVTALVVAIGSGALLGFLVAVVSRSG